MLFKELPQLIKYIENSKKIFTFDIPTNATIDFSDELVKELKNSKKLRKISISDYKKSPNLKTPLKQESIFKKLKENKIAYSFNTTDTWYDIEKIYKRNRTKEDIIKNYYACMMPC
ncbi:radical SAM protein, partial [Campylobacter novaezeelandiae]|nr:radical SAM protein [Campylobacter novaezeelandiae]